MFLQTARPLTVFRKDLDDAITEARKEYDNLSVVTAMQQSWDPILGEDDCPIEDHPLNHVHFCWSNLHGAELDRIKEARGW